MISRLCHIHTGLYGCTPGLARRTRIIDTEGEGSGDANSADVVYLLSRCTFERWVRPEVLQCQAVCFMRLILGLFPLDFQVNTILRAWNDASIEFFEKVDWVRKDGVAQMQRLVLMQMAGFQNILLSAGAYVAHRLVAQARSQWPAAIPAAISSRGLHVYVLASLYLQRVQVNGRLPVAHSLLHPHLWSLSYPSLFLKIIGPRTVVFFHRSPDQQSL
jgi:hypothetical protein